MEKLNEDFIKKISDKKKEPKWMLDFRIKAYHKFLELENPDFGPDIDIDFDKILYYKSDVDSSVDIADDGDESVFKEL